MTRANCSPALLPIGYRSRLVDYCDVTGAIDPRPNAIVPGDSSVRAFALPGGYNAIHRCC